MSGRLKIVLVSAEVLAALFKQRRGRQVVFAGLPEDAVLVDVIISPFYHLGQYGLKFESAEFPEVAPGHVIPQLELTVSEG